MPTLSIAQTSATTAATVTTLWPATAVPQVAAKADPAPVNLGVKFSSDVSGFVTGIKFYKGRGNNGTHVGSLWSSTGQLLARATFTGETATGWQAVTFSTPVPITAGVTYTASYLAPVGRYALNEGYFNQAFTAAPLRATAGVYAYGASSSFPSSQWNASNYWVDVLFSRSVTTSAPVASSCTNWASIDASSRVCESS